MAYLPTIAQPDLDLDGLRRFTEDELRRIAQYTAELDLSLTDTTLADRVTDLETEVATLTSDLGTVQTDLTAAIARIQDLEDTYQYLELNIPIGSGPTIADNGEATVGSLSITATGIWRVWAQLGMIGSGGQVLTHMHGDHQIGTTIMTSPGDGRTMAQHINSNHPNGWIYPVAARPYTVNSLPYSVNLIGHGNFTGGGTVILYGHLFAERVKLV